MILLTIRTDKPEAEIGLYNGIEQIAYETWTAHRQLAETLHAKIRDLVASQSMSLQNIQAIACFKGPGSFTGLRIGLTVANALAYALQVPIIADMDATKTEWKASAIKRLLAGESDRIAMPEYGADVHITLPKGAPSA